MQYTSFELPRKGSYHTESLHYLNITPSCARAFEKRHFNDRFQQRARFSDGQARLTFAQGTTVLR